LLSVVPTGIARASDVPRAVHVAMSGSTPLTARSDLFPLTPLSTRLGAMPLRPPPVTPGRPGLDRVLDLVTEHETHYRQQARAAPRLRPCALICVLSVRLHCCLRALRSRVAQEMRLADLAKRLADCEAALAAQLDAGCACAAGSSGRFCASRIARLRAA
jgi:hypothetical protein